MSDTRELFREDGYLRQCEAEVIGLAEDAIVVDQTVFYPQGGGQPGDTGRLLYADGGELEIIDTLIDRESGAHLHRVSAGTRLPLVGERVVLVLDWERRHRLMRMHSCMHMLCAVIPAAVTGGSVRDGSARLDFDLPEPPEKASIEQALNRLIEADHPMTLEWITDAELVAQPELVRTMSVQPPSGAGRVRLVRFGSVDLQPCGGTHVASTGEIGPVRVRKIEKKGKRNRRITVQFDA